MDQLRATHKRIRVCSRLVSDAKAPPSEDLNAIKPLERDKWHDMTMQLYGAKSSSDQRKKKLTGLVKTKTCCASKDTYTHTNQKMKTTIEWKNFFANHYYLVRDLGQNTENLLQLSK